MAADRARLIELTDGVGGERIFADDPGYDELRTVWNAMVDRRPRVIVRCTSVADVVACVRAARELDLEIGVRCGGHSVQGHGVPDDGLMIDLSSMGDVLVDPGRRLAWVQGGALLGALDVAAQQHGLATTAGNVSHTGVGGLTLGGGMGWLARQHGLACDNVVSYEVVTATGEVVRASRDEHPDLFWALRGGGGNFGVVTEFTFRLHPVGTRALSVELDLPIERAATAMRAWRDMSETAPRQATFTALAVEDVVTLGFVWVGDPTTGHRLRGSFGALGAPLAERADELSYLALQTRDDAIGGHAYRRYWKGHLLPDLSDDAIDAMLGRGGQSALLPNLSLQAYGGAIADVAEEDSAFSHRDSRFEYIAGARWEDPAEDTDRLAVARGCAAAVEPFAAGVYVNALGDFDAAGVRRAYPPAKLERLTAVKDAYDPDNAFRLNANITPSRCVTAPTSCDASRHEGPADPTPPTRL